MVREDGKLSGVEAVLDKDLTGALLARTVGAACLVIATDVDAAAVGFGTERQEWLGAVDTDRLRSCSRAASSPAAAWGRRSRPRSRSPTRGGRSVITSLERLREGVEGAVGTRVPA